MPRLHCGVHGPPEKRSLTSAHPRLPPAEAEEAASTGISFTYVQVNGDWQPEIPVVCGASKHSNRWWNA